MRTVLIKSLTKIISSILFRIVCVCVCVCARARVRACVFIFTRPHEIWPYLAIFQGGKAQERKEGREKTEVFGKSSDQHVLINVANREPRNVDVPFHSNKIRQYLCKKCLTGLTSTLWHTAFTHDDKCWRSQIIRLNYCLPYLFIFLRFWLKVTRTWCGIFIQWAVSPEKTTEAPAYQKHWWKI